MATRMGAPGVRIEVHDRSGYSLVENPNAIGGVVGFAPKGELNKIQLLTNTAQQDTYFGLGFNNSRYNQGMYAARAVLNAGGHVEFVRPYGEEIDRTDDFKRDLKTDTYVVSYDRNAVNNKENTAKTSMKIDFFASTRYKTDGAAKYGVTRKINNIADTIVSNSNVTFNVDAADDVFNVKKNWVSNGGSARGETDMVMFALMNADPSGANRAYTSFAVDQDSDMTDDSRRNLGEITVVTKSKVGFAVDDIVYGPASGRATTISTFRVTNIVDKTVYLKAEDDQTRTNLRLGYIPRTLLYHDDANAVADGYDYLSVKTAVAGQGAKTFGSLHLNEAGLAKLKEVPAGSSMVFHDQDASEVYARVATSVGTGVVSLEQSGNTLTKVVVSAPDAIWVGDSVSVAWSGKSAPFKVTGQDDEGFQFTYTGEGNLDGTIGSAGAWTVNNTQPSNWVDSVNTKVLVVSDESTVFSVANDIVAIMRGEELGYGYSSVLGDIAKDGEGKLEISEDKKSVKLAPGGALEFVADDIVAITRASVDVTVSVGNDSGLDADNILWLGKVKQSDPITDTVEFYEEIVSDALPAGSTDIKYQLLNLTQTNKVAYATADTCTTTSIPATLDDETDPVYHTVKKSASYGAYMLTGVSGTVSGTYAENDTITIVYGGKTATGTVAANGSFTASFPASDGPIVDGGPYDISSGTLNGETQVSLTGVSVNKSSVTVPPVYTVSSVDIVVTKDVSNTNVIRVGAKASATVAGVADPCEGEVVEVKSNGTFAVRIEVNVDMAGTADNGDNPPAPAVSGVTLSSVEECADIYMVGNYTVMVPVNVQNTTPAVSVDGTFVSLDTTAAFKYLNWKNKGRDALVVDHSEKVLTDTAIGATFVALGLANIRYMDVNFSGNTVKTYDLTDEGEAVARLYLSVSYMYNGVLYEFDGTVVKYVYNDMQLYIGDSAETELEGSGVYFVLNDSGVMEMFREDNSYDLSATVTGEVQPDGTVKAVPSSTMIAPAFNTDDPAIIHNAVWTYDPLNNMSTSTLSNAFNLFLDKDKSDVTFFVGAGLGLNNFGMQGYETLNTQLMQAVLNICELRKDCFALFDGVADPNIKKVLKLDNPASRFGSTLGRWGAIFDARPIFYDSVITKSNVEIAPSIAMASLITTNRRAAIFWHVPAGDGLGMLPGAWCRKLKYERRFNIPEDTGSDIALLCDIHVNPCRSNKKGIYCYGDFTMQMEDTAFNAINVTMLVAGIHKIFYNYLDSDVFTLNTTALRAKISGDLQDKLDQFMAENPAGLEEGSHVICDDTNNPPEVVEAHKLYVDLMLYPTASSRYIFLRTNVLKRSTGNVISTDISTGAR